MDAYRVCLGHTQDRKNHTVCLIAVCLQACPTQAETNCGAKGFEYGSAAEFMHVKPGKGAAFVRSKLKNCITGNMLDKTFRAGEALTAATVEKRSCQFTYVDGEDVRPLNCLLLQ